MSSHLLMDTAKRLHTVQKTHPYATHALSRDGNIYAQTDSGLKWVSSVLIDEELEDCLHLEEQAVLYITLSYFVKESNRKEVYFKYFNINGQFNDEKITLLLSAFRQKNEAGFYPWEFGLDDRDNTQPLSYLTDNRCYLTAMSFEVKIHKGERYFALDHVMKNCLRILQNPS